MLLCLPALLFFSFAALSFKITGTQNIYGIVVETLQVSLIYHNKYTTNYESIKHVSTVNPSSSMLQSLKSLHDVTKFVTVALRDNTTYLSLNKRHKGTVGRESGLSV